MERPWVEKLKINMIQQLVDVALAAKTQYCVFLYDIVSLSHFLELIWPTFVYRVALIY